MTNWHAPGDDGAVQIEMPNAPQAAARDEEAWRWLLADARGRRVLRTVLRVAGAEEVGPLDRDGALIGTGRRQVACYLRERLQLFDPEGWIRFEAEHLQERHQLRDALEQQEALAGVGGTL